MIYLSNEIDIIDLKLHELHSVVDKFVIVEYPFTYGGEPYNMYYNRDKERFKEFEDKIIHVIDGNTYGGQKGLHLMWARQGSKALMDIIAHFNDDDFVIVCDGDAYVKREAIEQIDPTRHTTFRMEWCSYWMNAYCPHVAFDFAFGAPVKLYKERGSVIDVARFINPDIHMIDKSGWHWSKLGGPEKIIENINGYPHQEYRRNPRLVDPKLIEERISRMQGWDDPSPQGNPEGWKYEFRKYDPEYYPRYTEERWDIFGKYFKEVK